KINKLNHLEIGGVDCLDLAQEFGTPLYVMDEATVRNRCRGYLDSFRKYYPNTEVAYACKALCTAGILKVVDSEGMCFDVSSGGEVYTALKSGIDPKKLYFHGNNKTRAELKMALEAGVGRIMVDTTQEIINLAQITKELGRPAEVMMRINPGIEAHTHEYIKTGLIDSKFGVPQNEIEEAVQFIQKREQIKLVGFHAHIGSQIFDTKPFVDETKLLIELTKRYGTEELNIGGGPGIAYQSSDEPPGIEAYAEQITKVLKGQTEAKLVLEPGRSIVGNAGVTLYTVGAIKNIPDVRKYILVDGGMADNPRPILYQAVYDAKIANKANDQASEKVTIGGRFCESGDILIKDIKLPKVEVGDSLAVLSTGAYGYSMASNYNRVGRPAMVLVNNGQATLIVKREDYDDLVRNDVVI
ncbi:MAG: diaminopimelate decarboxylase, partial [Candidatus Margulisbacteria bacterium]|nr:diaminopimelate decarboxylase [Candidatus Margulisiibacteriota bacterium]